MEFVEVWKKIFIFLRRVWISIKIVEFVLPPSQTLSVESYKRYCHIGVLEGVVFWLLASSAKAQRTNFCSLPIKSLRSFNPSTVNHNCIVLPISVMP